MTQESLAHVAELDRKHISTIENGLTEPRIGTLIRIAGALGVPGEALIAGIHFAPSEHSPGRFGLHASAADGI